MKILVINCGSSSLKYQLLDMENESVLAQGLCERIGIDGSRLKHQPGDKEKIVIEKDIPNHNIAVDMVIEALVNKDYGVIKSMDEIAAVGHRIVHGGEKFSQSVILTDEVIEAIKECSDLAPLHNPANLTGIKVCKELMPNTPMVGVFDTAFHQTMPEKAYLYGVPYEYYEKHKVRRYGFHGTSHKYVANRAAKILGKNIEDLKTVVCHLGNGASICAVDGGKSVDTSMGLTPLEGLIMGTRSGNIDPAIVQFIMEKENLSIDEMMNVLNKKSGILGISKISSDFREILAGVEDGNEYAIRAKDAFIYSIVKYVGAYAAAMNGIDVIVFTAGIGENNAAVRKEICGRLQFLGIKADDAKNEGRGDEKDFSAEGSSVSSIAITTNEELMIARDTKELLK